MPPVPFQLSKCLTHCPKILNLYRGYGVSAASTQGVHTHYQHDMTRINSTTGADRVDHLEMPCDKPGPGVLQVTPRRSRGVRYTGGCTS
jgi:hypothetical protein